MTGSEDHLHQRCRLCPVPDIICSSDDKRAGSISAENLLAWNPRLRLGDGSAAASRRNTASPSGLPSCRETMLSLASRCGCAMYSDALFDELRRVEREVVEGERQLAEQEALLRDLKVKNADTSRASAELALMREAQQRRQTERNRLLSLLQP
jgi:hypothetical protein